MALSVEDGGCVGGETGSEEKESGMIDCAICEKDIRDEEKSLLIEDEQDQSVAWIVHSSCYTKFVRNERAKQKRALIKAQNIERQRIAEWNALSKRTA